MSFNPSKYDHILNMDTVMFSNYLLDIDLHYCNFLNVINFCLDILF